MLAYDIRPISDQTYTESALTPKVVVKDGSKVLTKNADYTVSYSNNINAGTVTVTIMEIGSYEGTTGKTFQITSRSMGEVTVEKIGKSTVFFGGGVVQYFM